MACKIAGVIEVKSVSGRWVPRLMIRGPYYEGIVKLVSTDKLNRGLPGDINEVTKQTIVKEIGFLHPAKEVYMTSLRSEEIEGDEDLAWSEVKQILDFLSETEGESRIVLEVVCDVF